MGESRNRLILMAREPRPGRVKTRLEPLLGPEKSCLLYRAMLEDSIRASRSLEDTVDVEVHVHPAEGVGPLSAAFPGLSVRAQEGTDLAARMERAVTVAREGGATGVVLRNTDSPDLPASMIRRAFELLESGDFDLVFGPDLGGGYYLVGQRAVHPGLFGAARMSTADNRLQTVEAARHRGLRVTELEPWADVDRPEDLEGLVKKLRVSPSSAPATARALQVLGLIGTPTARGESEPLR